MNEVTVTASSEGIPHEIKKGLVSIVIGTYINDYSLLHYTGHCIGSVREHTDPKKTPYEIVIVDDGSALTLPDPKMYKVDKYVRFEENKGLTKVWNTGIRVSQGEYICLLNNDTMVFDHWLEDLLEALHDSMDLVMATPMYGDAFARAPEAKVLRDKWEGKDINQSFDTFRDFSCVLTRRDLFDELGLFDERYKVYVQDTDFLKQMELKGKKFGSTKKVPIFHIIGATTHTLAETPVQMNADKELFKQKWEGVSPTDADNPQHPDPSPKVEDIKPEEPKEYTLENMPKLVRTVETGDRAFLVRNGRVHWVTNPETLQQLGLGFNDIVTIPKQAYSLLAIGEPINLYNVQDFKDAQV